MADTPENEDTEQQAPGTFRRLWALGNEAAAKGIINTLAFPGLAVDFVNNAPRLFGFDKFSPKPTWGSDWIRENLEASKKATDGFTGVVPLVPETTAETLFSNTVELGTEVLLPLGPLKLLGAGKKVASVTTTTTTKAGVNAAEASAQAGAKAAQAPLSKMAAWKISRDAEKGFLTKLKELVEGGHPAMADKMIYEARVAGKINRELVVDAQKLPGMPESITTKLADIATARKDPGFLGFNRLADNAKAFADRLANHPVTTAPGMLWDAFAAQWRAPAKALKLAKEHKAATAALVAGGTLLDGATDGATTRLAANTLNTVGGAYLDVDKLLLGTALTAGAGALNLASTDGAQKFALSTGKAAADVTTNTPGFLLRLGAGIAGKKPEDVAADPLKFSEEHPVLSYLLPNPVKHTLAAAKVLDKTSADQGSDDGQTENPALSLKEKAANAALDSFNFTALMKDPGAAWSNLKKAAKANPQMAGLIEVVDKYPGMKWGVMAGIALGGVFGEGGVSGKMKSAFKLAVLLAGIFDAVAWVTGNNSAIASMVNAVKNSSSGVSAAQELSRTADASRTRIAVPEKVAQIDGPAIKTDVNLGKGFNSALQATTPPDVAAAQQSATVKSLLGSAFSPDKPPVALQQAPQRQSIFPLPALNA